MKSCITSHFILLITIVASLLPPLAWSAFIPEDTVWSGERLISEDLLVPPGVTLTIRAGSTIVVTRADTTKTDPEFLSPLHEIMVRGNLVVEGAPDKPVIFRGTGEGRDQWGGIIVTDGGTLEMRWGEVMNGEGGVSLFDGRATLRNSRVSSCRTGLIAASPRSSLELFATSVEGNDYGAELIASPCVKNAESRIRNNSRNDVIHSPRPIPQPPSPAPPPAVPFRVEGAAVLAGDTIWSGRIRIDHQVRIPEGSRLFILPGTVIEFETVDTNGDRVGETGLLIQGTIHARGTPKEPIRFHSSSPMSIRGGWDGINIMNSDGAQNIFEWCIFEDAYRPLHFHFSNVLITDSVIRHNLRGVQFQESIVVIRNSTLSDNTSGLQGRDSAVEISGVRFIGNLGGFNMLRCAVVMGDSLVSSNLREGGRIREGSLVLSSSRFIDNRNGLLLADLNRGEVTRSILSGNAIQGIGIKNCLGVRIAGNHIGSNGTNGMSIQEGGGTIRGNLFTANGERGIGVISFSGAIRGNLFSQNRIADIENEGSEPVDARENWWDGDPSPSKVLDHRTDPRRGRVSLNGWLSSPPPFEWPSPSIDTQTTFAGEIHITTHATVPSGVTLTLSAGSRVRLAPGIGITVNGTLLSRGTTDNPVKIFPLVSGESGAWGELLLEHATGSKIQGTIIEGGTWGVHSHFTDLVVESSTFRKNGGGLRFRSGPVRISSSRFEENGIGIRSYIGDGEIVDSVITGNDIGVFVREGGASLRIRGCDLSGNRRYAVRMGDFNSGDLDASGNWWGEGTPSSFIFDEKDEEGVGTVIWEPPLSTPPPGGKGP